MREKAKASLVAPWKELFTRFWELWNRFWFEANGIERLRLFRVAIATLFFAMGLIRTFDLELYFSESGLVPLGTMSELLPMDYRKSIFQLFPSNAAIWAGHVAQLVALAALAVGVVPRVAAIVAFALHVSFMHRNMTPSYGVDMIGAFFLFYLCLADCSGKARPESLRRLLSSMALRFIQLQVCIIYAYSGLDKARGQQWWAGESIWGVVSNTQLARFDLSTMAHFPLLIVAMTYATLAWEIYFPVLVWVKPLRMVMLLFGVALHLGIAVVIQIPFFAALMVFSYIVFLDDSLAARILKRLRLSPR